MTVIVDTSVWSQTLRRRRQRNGPFERELGELIDEGRVVIIGAIRQEILSGVKTRAQFSRLRSQLRAFADLPLSEDDYEDAATLFNRCRSKGVQGSNTDFLICAAALRRDCAIFTTDKDFVGFARVLPIRLHAPRD